MEEKSPALKKSDLCEVELNKDIGVAQAHQQGFDSTAEQTKNFDKKFKPQTFDAKEKVYKSKAKEKSSFVSLQTGVS